MMEVLLLADVPDVGQRFDLLRIDSDYALLFLLPRRLALIATPSVRARYSPLIARRAKEKAQPAL